MRRLQGFGFALLGVIALEVAHAGPGVDLRVPVPALRDDDARAWWNLQRAYPAARIPSGAYARGREAMRVLRERSPHARNASPWKAIGPAPLDTAHGGYAAPNMSPSSGRAAAIAVDPTNGATIYAGYALGGVWKTTDGGETWAPLMDLAPTLAVGSLAIDPAAPQTIYVGTGEPAPYLGYAGLGIFKSTDGGATFAKLGDATFDGLAIGRIVIDGAAGRLYATATFGALGRGQICNEDLEAEGQGLYRSADGGATWTKLVSGQIVDLEIDTSVTPRRILVSDFATGALLSEDGGATWAAPQGLPTAQDSPRARRIELAIAPSKPSVVYAGMTLGSASAIYVSLDGGKSFSPMDGAPDYCGAQCYYDNSVEVDPSDEGALYVAGSLCGVWKTADALDASPTWINVSMQGETCDEGQHWKDGYVHPDVHGLAFDPASSTTVFAASDGGVARSTDAGSTWSQLNAGVGTTQIYGLCADPRDGVVLYGGSQDGGSFKRTSTDPTWLGVVAGDGGPCAVDVADSNTVIGSGQSGSIFRTSDAFASKAVSIFDAEPGCEPTAPGCGDRVGFIAPLVGDPTTAGTFYVGTYRLWKTDKGGAAGSFRPISGDLTTGAMSVVCPNAAFKPLDDALTSIAVAPSAPATIYTGSQAGAIFATHDGGGSWNRIDKAPLPSRWVSAIAIDPHDDQTLWAAYSGFDAATPSAPGHVFRSSDGGASWSLRDIGADVPVDTLLAHPVGSGLLYAGTDTGVLVTTDGGHSWSAFDEGLPSVAVYSLVFQRAAGALVAGTFGRSAWSRTFGAGSLSATPSRIPFAFTRGGAVPAPSIVRVANGDVEGSLASFTITSGAPWLTVGIAPSAQGASASGEAAGAMPTLVKVIANPGTNGVGVHTTTLTIAPAGGGAPIVIPVELTVKDAPPSKAAKGCGCRIAVEGSMGDGAAFGLAVLTCLARRRSRRRPRDLSCGR